MNLKYFLCFDDLSYPRRIRLCHQPFYFFPIKFHS